MPEGQCRLCGVDSIIKFSHILPAFAYRWLRETSGNGYMRSTASPNQRMQDGLKRYWLCASCEGILSESETRFANDMFYPYTKGASSRIVYGDWMLRFCISVSWRVLKLHRVEGQLKGYDSEAIERIDKALEVWKDCLLHRRADPASFQQHMLPLGPIVFASELRNLPTNINRYMMRTIDMDLVKSPTTNFVYSKLGRFMILGFIREDQPSHWQGTKIHIKNGVVEPSNYVLPDKFLKYISSRAIYITEQQNRLSDRQRKKIDSAFQSSKERLANSDQLLAMQSDMKMFGEASFKENLISEELREGTDDKNQ
jgi:hypothetical protein